MTDITIRTQTLPAAYAGVAYEAGIAETGSLTAVTNCVVATGSLPPGLAIASDFTRITGTPTGAAIDKTYTFTVTMTDTAGSVTSSSLTISVYAQQNPNGPLAAQQAAKWTPAY